MLVASISADFCTALLLLARRPAHPRIRRSQPVKIPPNRRKTARASLRRIAKKLGIRFQVGRSVRTSLSERDPSDQTSE
jgi:hypothetical protein